jgi:hypothetical protein
VEDYDGQIGYEYLESYREMNRLQEQYDAKPGTASTGKPRNAGTAASTRN